MLTCLPKKTCQKFVHFELRQAPDSLRNIFSKRDKPILVLIINNYKTGVRQFFFYYELYSIMSFHMKLGTILLKMEYLKNKT